MNVHIIIPARLGSTRLKNKMLKKILGKTLIEHMCERALKLNFKNLVVATDSKEIIETVAKYNINTYFSSKKFNNGTERIRDYLIKKNIPGNDVIINIQGDELNFSLVTVRKMISFLKKNRSYEIITLYIKLHHLQYLTIQIMLKLLLIANLMLFHLLVLQFLINHIKNHIST